MAKPILEMSEKDIARFWAKVAPQNENGCMLWLAGTYRGNGHTHGKFSLHCSTYMAHRLAWFLSYGDPGELCVLHKCDVPECCNPRHLFVGTQADNIADRSAKGRTVIPCPIGESNNNAKLSSSDVLEIRKLYATGTKTQQELGIMFKVSSPHISAIITRKRWSHLEEAPNAAQ